MRRKTGYVQQRGNSWRIAYYDANHIRQFETWATEEDARRELAKRLYELEQGIPVSSKPNTVKFGELCRDVVTDYRINGHRSIDDIETRYRLHIEPVFGQRKASQITTAMIRSYIDNRQKAGAKPGTINRELEAIKRAYLLALTEGRILHRPNIPMLKENNVRAGFFTREEVDQLCAKLKEPTRSFVLFAFLTGWRKDEIRNLQWRNIDKLAGEIRLDVGTTKSGEGRIFPITPELSEILKRQPRSLKCPYIFKRKELPLQEFRKSWATACRKIGLPGRLFHDLRRSAARARQQEGFSEGQIMRMMGWKTRSVFDRYQIVTDTDIRERFDALNGAKNGAKPGTQNG